MESEATPRPWTFRVGEANVWIVGANEERVLNIHRNKPNRLADAELIEHCVNGWAALKAENAEQARLLGASGSREAALLARLEMAINSLEWIAGYCFLYGKGDSEFLLSQIFMHAKKALKAEKEANGGKESE